MEIEAEPKMIMISKRRGRRYYTILLTNQNEKILRLYFETTQIRNRWASNIAEAIDPGVSGFLRVQQIPGAHDTDSAQWKSRYFELRKSHEAIYLFRSREDKVEAKCLYGYSYISSLKYQLYLLPNKQTDHLMVTWFDLLSSLIVKIVKSYQVGNYPLEMIRDVSGNVKKRFE